MARKYQYTEVKELAPGDISVREYCNRQDWPNVQNFYNKLKDGKLPEIEIVVYCGLNFVRTKQN